VVDWESNKWLYEFWKILTLFGVCTSNKKINLMIIDIEVKINIFVLMVIYNTYYQIHDQDICS
jgi:hypothetical protein